MPIVIRIRCKDGQFRFNVESGDDGEKLLKQLSETIPQADIATLTLGNQPRGGPEMKADDLRGNTIAELGLKHGHLLYANYAEKAGAAAPAASSSTSTAAGPSQAGPSSNAARKPWELAEEESIDKYWSAQEGKIPRPRDNKFCRHGSQGMCDYCMPLEPYDARYHSEHNIKHLSYHAHLRKLNAGTNKQQGSSWIPPLEEEDYSVKVPCPSGQHASWPGGICSKCQPSAITLQRQTYRMVDHVEFSHPDLIENLLKFWRSSASQRFGFLLGRYEPYADVPMGIKAVVEAIHEPPQEPELDGVTIGVPWEDQGRVEALAKEAGLQFVGMIYSDLTADSHTDEKTKKVISNGKVLCKRHKDSFFMSGNEVIFAATLQNANSTPSKMSASGKFNSRFVTCVLSGNQEGEVGVEAYQVSEQAMAMVKADMIEASVNPNIIRVKPSHGKRYVPEVFFRYKNEYGLDVKESAKPTFPVEYLIVNVTNGFPTQSAPRFLSSKFPIENRQGLDDQSVDRAFRGLMAALDGGKKVIVPGDKSTAEARKQLTEWMSDWHLLSFLQTTGVIEEDTLKSMLKVAVSHDGNAALDELIAKPGWETLVAIAKESAPAVPKAGGAFGGAYGDALDDELTPEEIAAIIASTEASSHAEGTSSTPAFADARSAVSSRRPSPPPAAPQSQPKPPVATTSASRSATAVHPVDSSHRHVEEEFEWTGDDDEPIELDDDDEDEDDEDAFNDANSEVEEVADEDVQMSSRPAAPQTSSRSSGGVVDLTADDEDTSSNSKPCPTCTVLNPADADTCYLCGLPM